MCQGLGPKKNDEISEIDYGRNCSPPPDSVLFDLILLRAFFTGGVFTDSGILPFQPALIRALLKQMLHLRGGIPGPTGDFLEVCGQSATYDSTNKESFTDTGSAL